MSDRTFAAIWRNSISGPYYVCGHRHRVRKRADRCLRRARKRYVTWESGIRSYWKD